MAIMSLLSWERGLKFVHSDKIADENEVAPLVGAWIEIQAQAAKKAGMRSLLSWERGLKLQNK